MQCFLLSDLLQSDEYYCIIVVYFIRSSRGLVIEVLDPYPGNPDLTRADTEYGLKTVIHTQFLA